VIQLANHHNHHYSTASNFSFLQTSFLISSGNFSFLSQLMKSNLKGNYHHLPAQLKEPIFALHFGQESYKTTKKLF